MKAPFMVLQKRIHTGFSAIELMIVLAIAVILLTAAVPGFRSMIQSQRMTTATNDLLAAINLTRSEAIKRGARVHLMPAGGGADWTKGWVVFIDKNKNKKPDAGDEIIFSHSPVADGITIERKPENTAVQYNGTGHTQAGHLLLTLDQIERNIIINFLGRPRVCNPGSEKSCGK
jgi:type IV fimbrial biogenesis protein FimT